ncbi:MAG: hypothetical protein AAF598_12275 [Bacteroidota bacterium]
MKQLLILLISFSFFGMSACQEDETTNEPDSVSTSNVFVMPVRRVKTSQDIEAFKATRDAYVATLEAEAGTITDREIQPFFDFIFSGQPLDSVFVGITSFTDFETFQAIGDATGSTPEANAFFSTFDFLAFEVLQPLDPNLKVDLAELAPLGSNQVWEIAIRDISQYATFDQADYEQRRDDYLEILAAQNGFLREIQWQSISNPNVVVGMTIYRDAAAVQAINSDQTFIDAYTATGFLQNYPPNVFGSISTVLK